jgi:hypothetical protein
MPYIIVEDFSGGVDLRKASITSPPGTLRQLRNAFVNAGGEIEKRKTFTTVGNLPAGDTVGLAFRNDRLAVFGTEAAGAIGALPSYTDYYQLIPTDSGRTLDRILDTSNYAGSLYVIARLDDGSIAHFYVDGATATQIVGAAGTNATAHQMKMYRVNGRNLSFSALDDPEDLAGTGSGTIDVTAQDAGSTELVGIEQYYSYLLLMARNAIQIWQMDVDPANNALVQVLGSIGLVAPLAAARYGNGDVLLLSDTGIRSIRARDSSNAAVLNDIGSPIDARIAEKRADLTPAAAEKIVAMVDPLSGHFWLVWGAETFVLAYYPNSKVTAWSTFIPPLSVDYVTLANSRLAFRAGDSIYVYGSLPPSGSPFDPNTPVGSTSAVYDASQVVVELPPIDVGKPASDKTWQAMDVACEGTWQVYVNPDPAQTDAWVLVNTINNTTYGQGALPLDMRSTHLAVKLVSVGTGRHRLARVVVHYEDGSKDHAP